MCIALYIFLYLQHQHTQTHTRTHRKRQYTDRLRIHICSSEPFDLKGINNTVKSDRPPNDPICNVPLLHFRMHNWDLMYRNLFILLWAAASPPPPPSSALSPCPAAHSQPIKHAAWRGFSLCSQAKSLGSRKKGKKRKEKKKKKHHKHGQQSSPGQTKARR